MNDETTESSESPSTLPEGESPVCAVQHTRWRLCAITEFACWGAFMIAVFYSGIGSLRESTQGSMIAALAWILAQALLLTLPGLIIGLIITRYANRIALWVGSLLTLAVPTIVLLDNIAYGWVAERFFSETTQRVFANLGSLVAHVAPSTWQLGVLLALGFGGFVWFVCWSSDKIATLVMQYPWLPSPKWIAAIMCLVAVLLSLPAVWQLRTTRGEMFVGSQHHPFCAFRILPGRRAGGYGEPVTPRQVDTGQSMRLLLDLRESNHDQIAVSAQSQNRPDVVLVIVESFRPELVDAEAMPALHELALRGIHCKQHYASGNATNHGIFGLMNGLSAVWYSRKSQSPPILNRLFREAGYELGFFGGHQDWRKFYMDGFVNREQFDVFMDTAPDGLNSDRQTVTRAMSFLDEPRQSRSPRLAVVYLYATHATYHSYASDRIFRPAAKDGFVIPFSKQDAPFVWNRYKNSAHSMDGLMEALFDPSRITVVTGDHGESFQEDGVCGHGVRISRFQNMTPTIIAGPGIKPASINQPTCHADILPTLLAATGTKVKAVEFLDGTDLSSADRSALADRVLATRNYLTDHIGLVGGHQAMGSDDSDLFAIRAAVSLQEWSPAVLSPIDENGNEIESANVDGKALLQRWIADRFGEDVDQQVASVGGEDRSLSSGFTLRSGRSGESGSQAR